MASHEGVLEHSTLEEYFPDINAPVNEVKNSAYITVANTPNCDIYDRKGEHS